MSIFCLFLFLINGSPFEMVQPSRGIRQGDPLSPYLFLIIYEGLSHLINKAVLQERLSGMKISASGPAVTHLLFADDSLLFCKAEVAQVDCVMEILSTFEACSGQEINLEKSSIFLSKNAGCLLRQEVCSVLRGVKEQSCSKYLGLPKMIGRSKK